MGDHGFYEGVASVPVHWQRRRPAGAGFAATSTMPLPRFTTVVGGKAVLAHRREAPFSSAGLPARGQAPHARDKHGTTATEMRGDTHTRRLYALAHFRRLCARTFPKIGGGQAPVKLQLRPLEPEPALHCHCQ
jgi:hypothetical protein